MTITMSEADAADLELYVEALEEALTDPSITALRHEDEGWMRPGDTTGVVPAEFLKTRRAACRVHAIVDPLIRRAVSLHVGYVWGGGVQVGVKSPKGGQDPNTTVQAFLADPANLSSFTSAQAREQAERDLQTDGELFHALFTAPRSGRVQVRAVPPDEITEIITNPEDADEVWFYRRDYTARVLRAGDFTTTYADEQRTTYYPDVWFHPARRPRTIDGHEVRWDAPVIHTKINPVKGRGTPDLLAAIPWSIGYKEFLEDWARIARALSRFAWHVTAKTKGGASAARAAIRAGGETGEAAITGGEQKLEAIGKSGATIDANSGRPMAALVAAATGWPVTMLLADPGVTGARATAETLDRPVVNMISTRQRLHGDLIGQVLEYVVREAVRSPEGSLKGRIVRDPVTGREIVTLQGDEDYEVEVTFPTLEDADMKAAVDAIVAADSLDKIPEELVARLVMTALGVEDVDGWLEKVMTDQGEFFPPSLRAALQGPAARVQAGDLPPEPEA